MNISKECCYTIKLTREEISELWNVMYSVSNDTPGSFDTHGKRIQSMAQRWYDKLEDTRPAGGFN